MKELEHRKKRGRPEDKKQKDTEYKCELAGKLLTHISQIQFNTFSFLFFKNKYKTVDC